MFDVGVPDAEVFDMPMEFGLELMAVVRSNVTNTEWEILDDGQSAPARLKEGLSITIGFIAKDDLAL